MLLSEHAEGVRPMGIRLRDVVMGELPTLRYEPTEKRIRASWASGRSSTARATLLVWEPKRVVPKYAVPAEDVDASVAAPGGAD